MAHSSTMEKLGSPAPDFNLKNWNPLLQQESYQLDSFKNHRSLLVAFFCNHCPYVVHIRESFVHFAINMSRTDWESWPSVRTISKPIPMTVPKK